MSTLTPADPGDLICDTCSERFPDKGNMLRTFDAARVRGWHIYQGVQVRYTRSTSQYDATVDTRILCPACVGTPRTRVEVPPVLEGQADLLEDLGVTVEPVEKETKPKKGRAVN